MNFLFGSRARPIFEAVLGKNPSAQARIRGDADHKTIGGNVSFFNTASGVLVFADLWGMPKTTGPCRENFHAFHIHEGNKCSGNAADPFADAKGHYNPNNCEHPSHAGDMPPLMVTKDGRAFLAFVTDRFELKNIIGRTVIIHSNADDFHTQPSGSAGKKIACGLITQT